MKKREKLVLLIVPIACAFVMPRLEASEGSGQNIAEAGVVCSGGNARVENLTLRMKLKAGSDAWDMEINRIEDGRLRLQRSVGHSLSSSDESKWQLTFPGGHLEVPVLNEGVERVTGELVFDQHDPLVLTCLPDRSVARGGVIN